MTNSTHTYGIAKKLTVNKFTKTGYTFAGWATSKTGDVVYTDEQSVSNFTSTNNDTVNLYAKWTAKKFTVTFDANGGSVATTSKTVTYNSTYGDLPTPTRTGYTFSGWYTAKSDGTKITSSSTVSITSGQTLYARWTANKVYINYKVNGGTITTSTDAGTWSVNSSGLIYLNGSVMKTSISYGGSLGESGLINYNNSSYLKVTKTGYNAVSENQWICLSGCSTSKTFNQVTVYKASDFCDASDGDCTVTVGVNWVDNIAPTCTILKTISYSSSGVDLTVECSYKGSGCVISSTSYSNVKSDTTYTVKDNSGNSGTCSVDISYRTRYKKRTYNSCLSTENLWGGTCIWHKYLGTTEQHTVEITGATSKSACETKCDNLKNVGDVNSIVCESYSSCVGGWGSWSDYTYTSCTESSTVDCSSIKQYY